MASMVPRIEEGAMARVWIKLWVAKMKVAKNMEPAIRPQALSCFCVFEGMVTALRLRHMTTKIKKTRTAPA